MVFSAACQEGNGNLFPENFPERFPGEARAESGHKEEPCFLTGESTAEDDACPFERGRAAFVTVFLFHASPESAAHKDDRDASGEGVPHAFVCRKGDVAAAESFGDDAGGSAVCCRAEDIRFCPCGAFHEPHRPGEAVGMDAGPADREAAPEDPPAGDGSRGPQRGD